MKTGQGISQARRKWSRLSPYWDGREFSKNSYKFSEKERHRILACVTCRGTKATLPLNDQERSYNYAFFSTPVLSSNLRKSRGSKVIGEEEGEKAVNLPTKHLFFPHYWFLSLFQNWTWGGGNPWIAGDIKSLLWGQTGLIGLVPMIILLIYEGYLGKKIGVAQNARKANSTYN